MKTFNFRELKKLLKRNGWSEIGSKGNHRFFRNENDCRKLTVPHSSLNQLTVKKLIKEYNICLGV